MHVINRTPQYMNDVRTHITYLYDRDYFYGTLLENKPGRSSGGSFFYNFRKKVG